MIHSSVQVSKQAQFYILCGFCKRGTSMVNPKISIDWGSGQRESFFQSRDENESFSDSISFIETRPRIPDTYSQASRRDREKISSNLGHRDEIEIYYLHSQASRREREFHWSDLGFRDKNEKSKSCHPSLNSGLKGLTILHAISGRLTTLNVGLNIFLDVLPFWSDPVMFS